ncbi:MAG: hypothetical protein E7505_06185 [Ruminococcus sp.]|nr:hypothetical protein [Ruminococcus sp.]
MATETKIKRKSKDSVFVKFFSYIENVKKLYEEFHPEVADLTEDDIQIQTLNSAIVNTIYNDLGFIVKDRFVVLVEAQSTWNPNMALRMLFYISETYRRYLMDTMQSEHSTTKINLPEPEFYMIYTGEQTRPSEISLSREFFGGKSDLELKIKVLSEVDTTLAGQYVGFCKVFNEQRRLHENSIEAAIETYRICIEKGYLREFMKRHEKEVIDMMEQLFDEEVMRKQYDIASRRAEREEGRIEGEQIGLARGEQIGLARGEQIGLARGEQIGLARGEQIGLAKAAEQMRRSGLSEEQIKSILSQC